MKRKQTISFSIDNEIAKFMKEHKEVNWSVLVNLFLKNAQKRIEEKGYNLKDLVLME